MNVLLGFDKCSNEIIAQTGLMRSLLNVYSLDLHMKK